MMIKLLNKVKGQKGFTLIELLVVVAILGILAAIAVPRFMESQKAARGSKIVADLRTIDGAITMALSNGVTTPSDTNLVSGGYLASFPKPPVGDVKFPNTASKITTVAADTKYVVESVTNSGKAGETGATSTYRGTLSSSVVEDLTL